MLAGKVYSFLYYWIRAYHSKILLLLPWNTNWLYCTLLHSTMALLDSTTIYCPLFLNPSMTWLNSVGGGSPIQSSDNCKTVPVHVGVNEIFGYKCVHTMELNNSWYKFYWAICFTCIGTLLQVFRYVASLPGLGTRLPGMKVENGMLKHAGRLSSSLACTFYVQVQDRPFWNR